MHPCYAPWGLLQVDMVGEMRPCCFIEGKKFGNLRDYATLEEAYNNDAFTDVRRNLANGDFAAAGCANCKLVKVNGIGVIPPVEDAKLLDGRENLDTANANFKRNVEECLQGKEHLASAPCQYTITVSHKCNIDCFMCWQRDAQGNYDHTELQDDVVAKLDPVFRVARNLHWVGGEPFALRPVHRFIQDFDTATNPDLRFMATTNALLLKSSILEKLAKFKNVTLVLSIDGVTKKTYEYIRTGGSWETLLETVPQISKVALERGWFVCMNFVVMVSNFHEIPAALEWARKFHFHISFDPVSGERLTTENLFQYPELIQRVPNWRGHLDEALRLAESGIGDSQWDATFKENVRQRVEHLRNLLTAGEQQAKETAGKRWFFPLNLLLRSA